VLLVVVERVIYTPIQKGSGAALGIEDQMRKWLLIASLVISVGGSSALAEDQRNVTVVNG
jgi:hypothetical protein